MGSRVLRKRAAMARFILRTVVTRVLGALLFTVASYGAIAQAIGEPAKLNSIKLFDGSEFDPQTITGGWFDGVKKELEAALAESP